MVIHRVTLFRVTNEANMESMANAYKTLSETSQKNGKPYILSLKAGQSLSGDRGKGYTFAAVTNFSSMEDMKYYDEECEAHKILKAFAYDKVEQPWQPPLTVFFEE